MTAVSRGLFTTTAIYAFHPPGQLDSYHWPVSYYTLSAVMFGLMKKLWLNSLLVGLINDVQNRITVIQTNTICLCFRRGVNKLLPVYKIKPKIKVLMIIRLSRPR